MNTGPGQPDREPLTPEERELAQRLSRLGPSAGPHASVDARILAAAHDAVIPPRVRARPRRWPVALGVAASLALAVGIAWRLRPLPEPPPPLPAESAASTEAAVAPAATVATMDAPSPPQEQKEAEPVQFEQAPAVAAQQAAEPAPKREAAPPAHAEPVAIADEARSADATGVADESAPAAPKPQPRPAAATATATTAVDQDAASLRAPPEAEARLRQLKAAQAEQSIQPAASKMAAPTPSAPPPAAAREEAPLAEDIEIVGSDSGDEPPAYANSPQVREAWLQRIRELIAEGKAQEAHDSLDEFQRRYPDQPLPDDLQRFQQSAREPVTP